MTSDASSSVMSRLPLIAPVVLTLVDAVAPAPANNPSSAIAMASRC